MKRRILMAMLLVLLSAASVGCNAVQVDAGDEAVLSDSPVIFGSGGMREQPLVQGFYYTWFSTHAQFVDIKTQMVPIHFDDAMTKDGVPLDFEASFRFQVIDSVKFAKKYGNDKAWFAKNLEQTFRNATRDAVKKHGMNEMAIDASASSDVDKEISDRMQLAVTNETVPIKIVDITLGRANPPDSIKHQRIETATQEQRIQTEKQRALAENTRLEAERSRAAADNAYRQAMSLDPDQFLNLESIKAMEKICGQGNCQFVTNGTIPLLGMKQK